MCVKSMHAHVCMYVYLCGGVYGEGSRLHRQNALKKGGGSKGCLGNKRYTKHSGEKRKETEQKKNERNKSSMSSKKTNKKTASRFFFFLVSRFTAPSLLSLPPPPSLSF